MELLGKSRDELREWMKSQGEPAYRGDQLYRALYQERNFEIAKMTALPAPLREKLAQEAAITLPAVRQKYLSKDGSVRYLFALAAGEQKGAAKPASVEAVWMPSENRQTICISTQAGCAVDCQFCMTAQLGLIRNLTAGEIIGQILVAFKENAEKPNAESAENPEGTEKNKDKKQTNVVLM